MSNDFLTTADLAEWIKVSPGTLVDWRYKGIGPTYVHVGKAVRYRRAAVEQWITGESIVR